MDTRNFYDLWESNADGFPIRQFGALPEFCKAHLKDGDPSILTYLDGWHIEDSGNYDADLQTGRRYAEMAVAYAREHGSPAFIAFVLDAIILKTILDGNKIYSGIEAGFFQRLAQIAYCGSLS